MTFNYIWVDQDFQYKQAVENLIGQCLGSQRAKDAIAGWEAGAIKFLVVTDGNQVVACSGYGPLYFYKSSYFIGFNSVAPAYRGQDIGNTMTRMRLELIKNLGIKYIWSANKDSWDRMKKFEFTEIGKLTTDEQHYLVIKEN